MAKVQSGIGVVKFYSRAEFKKTSQGGGHTKMSSMNKGKKRSYKKYRGQGK